MQYQKEEVKERILKSAQNEFFRAGYYRASVLRIATDSKVTIGNLYRYFANKEKLFETIVQDAYEGIPKIVEQYYDSVTDKAITVNQTIYEQVADVVIGINNQYGRELVLLIEKSEGSKFASFGQALKGKIVQMFQEVIFNKQSEQERFVADIIACSFLESVFKILYSETSEMCKKNQMLKLIRFYFYDANKRFLEGA